MSSKVLQLAVAAGDAAEVERLVAYEGADINVRNTNGSSLLHGAVLAGAHGLLGTLLRCGADVNAREAPAVGGLTPLHYAAQRGDVEVWRGARFLFF